MIPLGISVAAHDLRSLLNNLSLRKLGDDREAGLCLSSLPWPRAPLSPFTVNGISPGCLPLGQWHDSTDIAPRRVLITVPTDGTAPDSLTISLGMPTANTATAPAETHVTMALLARSPHAGYVWERHMLRLECGGKSIEMAMGLRTGDETHWWEACRLVILEENESYTAFEMGGVIPLKVMTLEEMSSYRGLANPYLHKHNWLNGRIYGRLHRNGVCEIYAHHINSKFFDDGEDLENCIPVLGLRGAGPADYSGICGPWDGSWDQLSVQGVRFDFEACARFATPEQPGSIWQEEDLLVWQPYAGMELYGGNGSRQRIGKDFILRASEKRVLRGMARTLRFSLNLTGGCPRVVRYQAAGWWYGLCEELGPRPLLPVSNIYNATLEQAQEWVQNSTEPCGFEAGSLPRGTAPGRDSVTGRYEPGWEGEIGYGAFLCAWRTGSADLYDTALNSAYYFADVCVDHAAKLVRMHSYPPHAFSVPMNRIQAILAAYLETGDPYTLEIARAVTSTAHHTQLNSWPRLAVGRDACYARSAMLLYRYTGDPHYREMARECGFHVSESQREDGSFGDQGGGAGIHMWSGYITKPWMGLLALGGVLDYLEVVGPDPVFWQAVVRFGQWLMSERHERGGGVGWSYQHGFDGGRIFHDFGQNQDLDLPGAKPWHHDTLGRLLGYCTRETGDPKFLAAWAASRPSGAQYADHAISATMQFLPWVQDRLWNATWERGQLQVEPLHFGPLTPGSAVIETPRGNVKVEWCHGAVEEHGALPQNALSPREAVPA